MNLPPKTKSPGRPKGRPPRPHILIPGDEMWPVSDIAIDWGASERTTKRILGKKVRYHTGVAYGAIGEAREALAKYTAKKWARGR